MKKIIYFTICIFLIYTSGFSQKEFWGVTTGYNYINPMFPSAFGTIFKVDFDGQNRTTMHAFDSISGKLPYGRLLLASNGKLYGTASEGGVVFPPPNSSMSGGILYEYDFTFGEYKVDAYFASSALPNLRRPIDGVIELSPGKLYGTAESTIFKYDFDTEVTSLVAFVPSFTSQILTMTNTMSGELTKASNGMLYGTSQRYSACPDGAPFLGSIVRINPVNNGFTYIYPFNCTAVDGWHPTGSLVEGAPGKLYGTTLAGGIHGYENNGIGDGILFEYTVATNTFAKKYDFDKTTIGYSASPLINGGNGKLYGLLYGSNDTSSPAYYGSLYEYDVATSTVTIIKQFGTETPTIAGPRGHLLKGSDGNLYGTSIGGIFKYNISTGIASIITLSSYAGEFESIIEVCRKPSYNQFENTVYTICQNNPFVFELENSSAESYVWKKGSTILPSQTTSELHFENLTTGDSGIYTCTMTNECGTTLTMPIQLNVETCLGLDEAIGLKNAVKLHPNPASDILHVEFPDSGNFEVQQISISNMLGQTVYTSYSSNTKIDVSGLNSGIYVLQMSTDKGGWNGKFVKE